MKRYISAVLIPCLLMQLCGCYSFQEVTLEEFKSYKGKNDVKITTGKTEYIINKNSTQNYKMNWSVRDSSVLINKKSFVGPGYGFSQDTIDKKIEIKFDEITNIAIDQYDSESTIVLIVVIVAVAAIISLAIYESIHTGLTQGTLSF